MLYLPTANAFLRRDRDIRPTLSTNMNFHLPAAIRALGSPQNPRRPSASTNILPECAPVGPIDRRMLPWSHALRVCGLIAILPSLVAGVSAAPVPDPGNLITVAELEQIVGKVKEGPKNVECVAPEVSCEYTLAQDSSWIDIGLFPADQATFDRNRKSFEGKSALPVPELGKDAFVNPDYADFSAELFVKKGDLVLRVSMPKGPTAVESIKAIARKALTRM